MRVFFYGTLMDAEVRLLVLGPGAARLPERPATLSGHRRVALKGRTYPTVIRDPRGAVDGVVVKGLGQAEMDRLAEFEGDEYRLARATVRLADGTPAEASFFAASTRATPEPRPWSYDTWRRRYRTRYLRRLRAGLT